MSNLDFAKYFLCNRPACKEKAIELLSINQDKPIAIAIDGKWGVGKTYFWKNELAPAIKEKFRKYPIYTSVFGKRNENEIIQDLVAQFLARENRLWEKFKIFSKLFLRLMGLDFDPTFVFQSLKKKDLENTIVCIDDFERLSDKIPPQDILGLISELKENKGCNVIVIFNEDELFKDLDSDSKDQQIKPEENKTKEKKIFEKYKEKVFDFHIKFAPSTEEQFDLFYLDLLDTDFSAYEFLPEILNIKKLFGKHHYTNLRDLSRANYAYQVLFSYFDLGEYPSEDFKKTYRYIFYSIIYAYHFKLNQEYFEESSEHIIPVLLSPHTSIYNGLLRRFLPELKFTLELPQKIDFEIFLPRTYPAKICRDFLKFFVEKIISDTAFHKDYMQELETKNNDPKEASINFFLKHKDNTKAIPYIFGFRILNYAFEEEQFNEKIKSFSLEIVMEKHQKECLDLFNQWCDEMHLELSNTKDRIHKEYFWTDQFTVFEPLKIAFEELSIPLPQNKLMQKFLKR